MMSNAHEIFILFVVVSNQSFNFILKFLLFCFELSHKIIQFNIKLDFFSIESFLGISDCFFSDICSIFVDVDVMLHLTGSDFELVFQISVSFPQFLKLILKGFYLLF